MLYVVRSLDHSIVSVHISLTSARKALRNTNFAYIEEVDCNNLFSISAALVAFAAIGVLLAIRG